MPTMFWFEMAAIFLSMFMLFLVIVFLWFIPWRCDCGQPLNKRCICPSRLLYDFVDDIGSQTFYHSQLVTWIATTTDEGTDVMELVDKILSLECIIELGTDMYQAV